MVFFIVSTLVAIAVLAIIMGFGARFDEGALLI